MLLDIAIKNQLRNYLLKLQQPIELVASLEEPGEMSDLLSEIASLSDKVSVRLDGNAPRRPSFSVGRVGEEHRIHFAGIPLGHEFSSLVLALLQTSGHPPRIEEELAEQIRALTGVFHFETFVSLSCHNCPDVVQALNLMATLNPGITHTMIDGGPFREEAERREIMVVPSIFLNDKPFASGRMTLQEIVGKIDTRAQAREAEKISAKAPFDVLIVGGGPAGAAAAIYSARKGLRVGILAENFGGQILDTNSIENLVSIKETEGPALARVLEEHVRGYGVDITLQQRAGKLLPGKDGLTEIRLLNGATLRGKTVIVATGARWREMRVPGEKEYRTHGVVYCPHCDGPLFKGKRVAVVGGGNSGTEAAIDLAGIVSHVTLLVRSEFRADAVLRDRVLSLPNITVVSQAIPEEVLGDGKKVIGLVYKDRAEGQMRQIDIEGVFVQIGLLPNTEWLDGTLDMSPTGEIEIDKRGQTSLPGVFAAGDCTTVPYKQVVVAMGEGAKASLGAFEHLIRASAPASS